MHRDPIIFVFKSQKISSFLAKVVLKLCMMSEKETTSDFCAHAAN